MYLVDAREMREIDRFTIDSLGIPGSILMEHAGMAVVEQIYTKKPFTRAVVLCGHGNNGGDGLVVARLLSNRGCDASVWLLGDPAKFSQESRLHWEIWQRYGGTVHLFDGDWQKFEQALSGADLVVDALLGTGASGEVREPMKTAIRLASSLKQGANHPYFVSIDIPSGIDANTGETGSVTFPADLTVALALPKWGHYLYPGAEYVGELVVKDIAIPFKACEHIAPSSQVLENTLVRTCLPQRSKHSHKGTHGHVLLIAGSHEMRGAPVLAAQGALRSGAGMVSMALPRGIMSSVSARITEAVMWEWPEESGRFSRTLPLGWQERLTKFSCLAIGPGIGVWDEGKEWLQEIVTGYTGSLILDADGLNLLAAYPEMLKERKGSTVITPHPGEMARLAGISVREVERKRREIAGQFARDHQVIVVLKGTHTLIACPDGSLYLNPTGSPAMAKGGSGDVLTGIIASFIAQGKSAKEAALAGVFIHGITGEICGEKSIYSVTASDMVSAIGTAINRVQFDNKNTHFPGN